MGADLISKAVEGSNEAKNIDLGADIILNTWPNMNALNLRNKVLDWTVHMRVLNSVLLEKLR